MLRLGILGCGRIIEEGHLPALQMLRDRVRVVALSDPSELRRSVVGDAASVSRERRYESIEGLLNDPDVDLIDIAVPHFLHESMVLAATRAGRDIVLEKPMATSLEECDRMISAVSAAGRRLAVIHNYAYRAPEAKAIELIQSGAIGRPFLIRHESLGGGHYKGASGYDPDWRTNMARSGGGCLIDNAYHNLYLAALMQQSPITRVYARLSTFVQQIGVEDTALLLLDHEGGGMTSVQVSWAVKAGGRPVHEIHGTEGSIALRHDGHAVSLYRNGTGEWEHWNPQSDLGFFGYFAALIDALERDLPPPVGFAAARTNLEVIRAAYKSGESGRPVDIVAMKIDKRDESSR